MSPKARRPGNPAGVLPGATSSSAIVAPPLKAHHHGQSDPSDGKQKMAAVTRDRVRRGSDGVQDEDRRENQAEQAKHAMSVYVVPEHKATCRNR